MLSTRRDQTTRGCALRQCDAHGCPLGAGIANAVDQRLGLYICDIHNKYTFELLPTNSTAIDSYDRGLSKFQG